MATYKLTATYEDNKMEDFINFIINNADDIAAEINKKLAHDQYTHAKDIAENAVEAFYADYTPGSYYGKNPMDWKTKNKGSNLPVRHYSRKKGLESAYDIGIKDDKLFTFELGPDLMPNYHQGAEFVYENSFVHGYHGGSFGKEDATGFSPGKDNPYWRTPPEFGFWLAPAPQMKPSPEEMIERDWNSYITNEYPSVKKKTIDEVTKKYCGKFSAKSRR